MKMALATCVVIVFLGLLGLEAGGGSFNDMPMPGWIYWPITIVGIIGCIGYARDLRKAKTAPPTPPIPLDEQCAQAKADLDRMYFREHGVMPEWPEREEGKDEEKKDAM